MGLKIKYRNFMSLSHYYRRQPSILLPLTVSLSSALIIARYKVNSVRRPSRFYCSFMGWFRLKHHYTTGCCQWSRCPSSVFNRYLPSARHRKPTSASRKNAGDKVAPALGTNKSCGINKESETVIHPDNLRTKRTVAVSALDSILVINWWKSAGRDSKRLDVSIRTNVPT